MNPAVLIVGAGPPGLTLAAQLDQFGTTFRIIDRSSDLVDSDAMAMRLLGVRDAAQYLVRPDGYIAFRCAGTDLTSVARYLTALRHAGGGTI